MIPKKGHIPLSNKSCFCYKTPMHWEYFIFLLGYFVLILGVGFFFSPRMKNTEDFFLASRKLPAFLVYLSVVASWLGASSILVSVDEAYKVGLSSFWVMGLPAVVTGLIFAVFLAKPIRHLPIVSLPDLVEMRYGPLVRYIASLLIVWYMILLASSQMVALGQFLKVFCGTSYFYSLLIGTGVVLVYSIFGGFFSVVVTDGVQFFLLSGGLLGLFLYLTGTNSLSPLHLQSYRMEKENYFNFFFNFEENLLIMISFTLAWIISPIIWQRIQAAKNEKKAQQGLWAASGTLFIAYWGLVFIGMVSLSLFPSGKLEGPLLSTIISSQTGYFLGGTLFVAIVAAIMSTMDTAINTGALSLNRDFIEKIFFEGKLKQTVRFSRVSTFLVGAGAFLIAAQLESILRTLGLASEIMAEGLFIPGIAMIFLKKRKKMAGLLSLALGGGYSVLGFLSQMEVLPLGLPPWPYSLPYGLVLCTGGFLGGLIIDNIRK